jgi:hypothetical protein
MKTEESGESYKERLEDLIGLAISRNKGQFKVNLRKEIVKERILPEESDNLKVERDWYLLMADFSIVGLGDKRRIVTKVYAFGDADETDMEEQVIRIIANERLKMDYQRLRDAGIEYEEKFF